jgi:hypothetical protein
MESLFEMVERVFSRGEVPLTPQGLIDEYTIAYKAQLAACRARRRRFVFEYIRNCFCTEATTIDVTIPVHRLATLISVVFDYVKREKCISREEWADMLRTAEDRHRRRLQRLKDATDIIARHYLDYAYSPAGVLARRAAKTLQVNDRV